MAMTMKKLEVDDLCDEYETTKLMEEMQTTIEEVEKSEFYYNMTKMLRYNKNIRNHIFRVLGSCCGNGGDGDRLKIAVYGSGSIQFCYTAQYQLALAILLRLNFPDWIGGVIETFDPSMTPVDVKVLEALGCVKVLNENHQCLRRVNEPTLVMMFNLDYPIIRKFMLANWYPSRFKKMVLFTGSYQAHLVESIVETIKSAYIFCDSTIKSAEAMEILKSTMECVTEFNYYGRCPKKGYRISRTNQFNITSKNKKWPFHYKLPNSFEWPFRLFTWHFFNLSFDDDQVYRLEALLPETQLETMRMLRDGEEKEVSTVGHEYRREACLRQMRVNEIFLEREIHPGSLQFLWSSRYRFPGKLAKRKWCPPFTGWMKLNFSATFGNNQVGYGGVFHNENEECFHRYTGSLPEEHLEIGDHLDFGNAEALRKGLRFNKDMLSTRPTKDKWKLVIEGDSLSTVRWANGIVPPPERLVEVFKEIQILMRSFECVIFHIYTEANSMAIEMANHGVMHMASAEAQNIT